MAINKALTRQVLRRPQYHVEEEVADNPAPTKKKMSRRRKKELIFILVLLAYPVLQFLVTWIFVNSYSIILAFQNISFEGEVSFAKFDNFKYVIDRLIDPDLGHVVLSNGTKIPNNLMILINSLGYGFVSIFISLPLALVASYFLSKKMPLANVFRVIFFLPNIISIVALVYAFRMQFDSSSGLIYHFLKSLGIKVNDTMWPNTSILVYVYCIWAGIGYNVLLLSGAIGRVPKELFESAQMDGAGNFKQFTKIMIPMVWPTVVTMIVLGMTSILTLYLQPVLMDFEHTTTIAGSIFEGVNQGKHQYPIFSAFGLIFSFVLAPLILYIRKVISKKYSDTDC